MRIISLYFHFILLILLSSILSNTKKYNKKINTNIENQISSILKWAKTNNIYIHKNLVLNKNTDYSHNFFFFYFKCFYS